MAAPGHLRKKADGQFACVGWRRHSRASCRWEHSIPNSELLRVGFTFVAKILQQTDKPKMARDDEFVPGLYKITSMGNETEVSLEKIAGEDDKQAKDTMNILRVDLMTD